MDPQYFIQFTLKTAKGLERVGRFLVGDNRKKAIAIFEKLKCKDDVNETDMLYLEFLENKNGLPLNLKVITCTLEQLGENCKLIAKEIFKLNNLFIPR